MEFRVNLTRRVVKKLEAIAAADHHGNPAALFSWLADVHDQIVAAQGEVEEVEERERALAEDERTLRRQQQDLADAVARTRRRLELSEAAWELLTECMESGVGKAEILAIAQVCRQSRVEPASVADVLRKNLGLAEWADRLQGAVAQAEALRDQALEEAAGVKLAVDKLKGDTEALRAQLGQTQEQLAAQREDLQRLGAALRILGLMLDVIGDQRVDDLPARDARLVLGCLILVAAQVHPRACGPFLLPANARLGRFVAATPVHLGDLVPFLGSEADYKEMQQALAQRAAVAERIRAQPVPPPDAAAEEGMG